VSFAAALALLTLAAGAARAQTTTLIDTSLTVPVFLQTIHFQVTSAGGAQFIVGSGIFDPALEGIGFLSGPGYSQAFALTNGTINIDVFNIYKLPGPGEYSFSFTFANANGTSGERLAFSATVTELPPPAPPPNLCASVTCEGGSCDPSTGACVCTENQTLCGNTCTDLTSDASNCGTCGNVCTYSFTTGYCDDGTCMPIPIPG
jgi:hypothetical protein